MDIALLWVNLGCCGDNQAIAEINMDENSFVIEDNFFVPLPDNASGNITFTFTDNYCTSANYEYDYWWSRWSDFYFSNEETPYTARATVFCDYGKGATCVP